MFKCDLCLKEFSTKPRLNRHIMQKVCAPDEYICKTCNVKYDKYKSYWMHINRGCVLANIVKETDVKNAKDIIDIKDTNTSNILTTEFIKSIGETIKVTRQLANLVNLLSLELDEIKKINLEFMKFVNLELNQIHLKIDNSLIK